MDERTVKGVFDDAEFKSVKIEPATFLSVLGPIFCTKFGRKSRTVDCTGSPTLTLCFSSNFTEGYTIFAEILKSSKIPQNALIVVRALFRPFYQIVRNSSWGREGG